MTSGVTALQVVPSSPASLAAKSAAWVAADKVVEERCSAGVYGVPPAHNYGDDVEAGVVQLLVGRDNGVIELLSLNMCGTKGCRVKTVTSVWASQRSVISPPVPSLSLSGSVGRLASTTSCMLTKVRDSKWRHHPV